MSDKLPPPSCWVLTDGKIGDLVQCLGVAESLGLTPEQRVVRPRPPWSWLAPRGPVDPRERPGAHAGPLAPPFPLIAIASGRRTVPALRALKRASRGRTFTVFLKDPRTGAGVADVLWVPEHDRLRAENVIVTVTSPHRLTPAKLAAARAAPDPRFARMPGPFIGLILGGPGGSYRFEPQDIARIVGIARDIVEAGYTLLVTPSRRTPAALTAALRDMAAAPAIGERVFVWDGAAPNPYLSILALAQALVVTGDSVNMLGEAAATGAPIHIVETSGGHPKMTRFIDRLVEGGTARRWSGRLEPFIYAPVDATPEIAREIQRRYEAFRLRAE